MGVDYATHDAETVMVSYARVHQAVCTIELCVGLVLLSMAVYYFVKSRDKLNPVLKTYTGVLVPNAVMIINFLPLDLHLLATNTTVRHLPKGVCKMLGVLSITLVTALNGGVICMAAFTYRIVKRQPTSDKQLWLAEGAAWLFGLCIALIFGLPTIGTYKNLYCCIETGHHSPFNVVPITLVFVVAICSMSKLYHRVYTVVKEQEKAIQASSDGTAKASVILARRGILLVLSFYGCWGLIALLGVLNMFNVEVPVIVDMVAAWVAKLQPSVDSLILLNMLWRINKPSRTSGVKPGKGSRVGPEPEELTPRKSVFVSSSPNHVQLQQESATDSDGSRGSITRSSSGGNPQHQPPPPAASIQQQKSSVERGVPRLPQASP